MNPELGGVTRTRSHQHALAVRPSPSAAAARSVIGWMLLAFVLLGYETSWAQPSPAQLKSDSAIHELQLRWSPQEVKEAIAGCKASVLVKAFADYRKRQGLPEPSPDEVNRMLQQVRDNDPPEFRPVAAACECAVHKAIASSCAGVITRYRAIRSRTASSVSAIDTSPIGEPL